LAYHNDRCLVTLDGPVRLVLKVRRCHNPECVLYRRPYRPEAEGALALPKSSFGLDVLALVGVLRYAEHQSVPELHAQLKGRGVEVSERQVTNLLYRYEELLSLRLTDQARLREKLEVQGRVILALDGLQPDVGHEVLWVVRDCLSGEVLLARALLGSGEAELAPLLTEVKAGLGEKVQIVAVISDGQRSIRNAVKSALPGVPHQLCQYHYLKEAALPIFEADRHAKVALKKQVRGVRKIERALEGQTDEQAQAVRDYALAVRAALTDDGRPPLAASGLKLRDRLAAVAPSAGRALEAGQKGGRSARRSSNSTRS